MSFVGSLRFCAGSLRESLLESLVRSTQLAQTSRSKGAERNEGSGEEQRQGAQRHKGTLDLQGGS